MKYNKLKDDEWKDEVAYISGIVLFMIASSVIVYWILRIFGFA